MHTMNARVGVTAGADQLTGPAAGTTGGDHSQSGRFVYAHRDENHTRYGAEGHYDDGHQ